MRNFPLFLLFSGYPYSVYSFSCPSGFIEIPNEHKCVYPDVDAEYYPNAVRKCKDIGGDVVKIENVFENSILFGLLNEKFGGAAPYIGVEKRANGTWVYADGSPLTYTNWAPEQPTNTNNATVCAIMDPQTTQWRAAECSIARPSFCQVNGNDVACEPGWKYFDRTDSCYYLQNFTYQDHDHWQLYSWNDAEGICRRSNSHLTSIHSKEEDDFLYDLVYTSWSDIQPDPAPTDHPFEFYNWVFIGLNGKMVLGEYWTDGTPVDYLGSVKGLPTEATPWGIRNDPNLPPKGYERCWTYLNDLKETRFICKKYR